MIVDVGCGTGATASALGRVGRVVGVDFSPRRWKHAPRGPERAVACPGGGDTAGLGQRRCHRRHRHPRAPRRRPGRPAEFRRILKPGGQVVMTVPAYQFLWSEHDLALMHRRRYVRGRSPTWPAARASGQSAWVTPCHCCSPWRWPLAEASRQTIARPRPDQAHPRLAQRRLDPFSAARTMLFPSLEPSVGVERRDRAAEARSVAADRQRIVELFPTAHRAACVTPDRHRIVEIGGGGDR